MAGGRETFRIAHFLPPVLPERKQMGSGAKTPYFFGNLILLENSKRTAKVPKRIAAMFYAN